jgi:hypothetical protein
MTHNNRLPQREGNGEDSNKQKLIRTWLASLQNPPQILLIQEHHLDEQ